MRDKRITVLILTALCTVMLCGCGDELPELTPSQQEMLTEYSAALLLKYDSNTPSRLLPEGSVVSIAYVDPNDPNAVLVETTPETETTSDITVDNVPDVTSENVSVTDVTTGQTTGGQHAGFSNFLADLGVSFDYSGVYEVVDSYPEGNDVNPYFTVDATDGNKLLVIHFNLTNNSASDMDVNLNTLNLRYRVSLNGGKNKFVMTTLLENAILSYVGTLGSGQTEDIVAICEISEAEGSNIQTIDFTVRGDGFSDVMSLQ